MRIERKLSETPLTLGSQLTARCSVTVFCFVTIRQLTLETSQQPREWTRPKEDSSPGDPAVPHVWPPWRRSASRQVGMITMISATAQAALLGVLLGVSWRRIPGARCWCLAQLPCLVREAALEEVFRVRAGAGRDHRRLVQKVGKVRIRIQL